MEHVRSHTVDGSEIPNNHLGCVKPVINDGINYQPQLVSRISDIGSLRPFIVSLSEINIALETLRLEVPFGKTSFLFWVGAMLVFRSVYLLNQTNTIA